MINRKAIAGTERKAITWCGPYALALVSGFSYDEVYKKMLRAVNRGRPKHLHKLKSIKGVHNHTMEQVAYTLRCAFTFKKLKKPQTLLSYADELYPSRVYIVAITGHFLVLDMRTREVCDNQSKEWIPISESKHKRCLVRNVAEVGRHKLDANKC